MNSSSRRALVVFALFAVSALTASAAVVYTENFTRASSGGNLAVSGFGWSAYRGAGAVDISAAGAPANTDAVAISPAAGNPGPEFGALYAINPQASGQVFAAVETFAGGVALGEGSTISWTMGNANTASHVRVLVQVGGDGSVGSGTWYASNATYANTTAYTLFSNFSAATTSSVTFSLDFTTDNASWRAFALNPGSGMSVGSSAITDDLASNTITGIGLYMVTASINQAIRIDTISIDAAPVPEPGSFALLAGVSVLGFVAAGRRRGASS